MAGKDDWEDNNHALDLTGSVLRSVSPMHTAYFRKRTLQIKIDTVDLDEKFLCIAVTDNGLGISPDHAERIFEPFFRLQRHDGIEGTGLGLTICQQIVKAHHGLLHLDTSVVEGAQFLISLPRNAATAENGVDAAH